MKNCLGMCCVAGSVKTNYDDHKGAFWAAGVRAKGASESIVKYVKDILDQSGYEGEKLTFKTDQEPSIVALKRAVAAARTGETVPIESPVRASKNNGMTESAVGIWQGEPAVGIWQMQRQGLATLRRS